MPGEKNNNSPVGKVLNYDRQGTGRTGLFSTVDLDIRSFDWFVRI